MQMELKHQNEGPTLEICKKKNCDDPNIGECGFCDFHCPNACCE